MVPVLTPEEAAALDASKSPLPMPHPNLRRTPSIIPATPIDITQTLNMIPGQHNEQVLKELDIGEEERHRLVNEGAIAAKTAAKL